MAFHDAFLVATLLGMGAILAATLLINDCSSAAGTRLDRANGDAGSGMPVGQH
jgi:hypothetical protein